VGILLDQRTLEPALPNVTNGAVGLVVVPGVGHGQRLQNAADRLAWLRRQEQVKVVGHQTIAVQPERVTLLGLAEGIQENQMVLGGEKDISAVIASVEGMVQQTVSDGTRCTRHSKKLKPKPRPRQEKMN
jgi:hypothetical protein